MLGQDGAAALLESVGRGGERMVVEGVQPVIEAVKLSVLVFVCIGALACHFFSAAGGLGAYVCLKGAEIGCCAWSLGGEGLRVGGVLG
jgi:hypothetical protein